jgi:hypothetical protein
MRIFKINKRLSVVCNDGKTRNGFKHEATLMVDGHEETHVKVNYLNRTWESYEYETVLQRLLDVSESFLSDADKQAFERMIKNGGRAEMEEFEAKNKMISNIALMGEIFGSSEKEKNDWKARMIKAGLGDKGLIMPEDWDTLSEAEKKKRLDAVIKQMRGK